MDLGSITADLENHLAEISRKSEQGEIPNEPGAHDFFKLCQKLQSHAPDDWYEEAEDFAHLANQLCQAVKQNRHQDAILLIDSLGDAYNYLSSCF